ncbi:MAG: hypothetical protein D6797_08675 [Bdellovibrio sp.]|nr:MAG: hypothetical protein D6797_08675 [Bdellovibrio sp.]
MRETLRVNADRANVIKNKYLKSLEERLAISLEISDSTITIEGEANDVFFAKPIIEAIGRGFSLDDALKLLNSNYTLHIIELRDFCNSDSCMERVKARVIGRGGSIKTTIERATDSKISVFGHTVAVIAPLYSISYALEALSKIIRGAKHTSVLNYLSSIRKQLYYEKLSGKNYKSL